MDTYIDYTQTNNSKFFKALNQLWDFYHLMFTHKSNETFDLCHDDLYSQLVPLGYMVDTTEKKVSQGDLEEITRLLKEVKEYYKTTQKLKEPNWIYC